ncbi:MAG: ubiquinone/menaquinone biosynthesis methyltransferase, partial [Patescibacteria group bacterium]
MTGSVDMGALFDRVAPRYDLINRVISCGLDRSWRRALIRFLPRGLQPREILDLCCGTGMLLYMLAAAYPDAGLVGLDLAPGMLRLAGKRRERGLGAKPRLVQGDQNALPFEDGRFDLVTNAFGLRNSTDFDRSLSEMYRVLAPDGVMAVLELTRPSPSTAGRLFTFYFDRIVPRVAACLGGDPTAYTYLPATVRNFFNREDLAQWVEDRIGAKVVIKPVFGRVVTLLLARKPSHRL